MRTPAAVLVTVLLLMACTSDGGELTSNPTATVAPTLPPPATGDPTPGAPTPGDPTPGAPPSSEDASCAPIEPLARVDIGADGNRVANVGLDLAAAETRRVGLPGEPVWVVAHPGQPGAWIVVLTDGRVVRVDADGATAVDPTATDPESPPIVDPRGALRPIDRRALTDPLPDTRIVTVDGLGPDGGWDVWLAAPTDRYGHGVLGDRIEAAAIIATHRCDGRSVRIDVAAPDVVEAVSPLIGRFGPEGESLIVATLANGDSGARLVAWNLDGDFIAESAPIGRGNRWRNQLALAPVGPDGEYELIDVRTPHLGGIVEYFRLDGDELVRVAASAGEYTSHWIGSRNVDAGIVIDADNDGRLDVLVATSDRRHLAALTRTTDELQEIARRELGGLLSTNIAPALIEPAVAVGLAGGELVVFEQR